MATQAPKLPYGAEPRNVETTLLGYYGKRVTFELEGISCEAVRYTWHGPVYTFADLDRDGIREQIKPKCAEPAFHRAWTYQD